MYYTIHEYMKLTLFVYTFIGKSLYSQLCKKTLVYWNVKNINNLIQIINTDELIVSIVICSKQIQVSKTKNFFRRVFFTPPWYQ